MKRIRGTAEAILAAMHVEHDELSFVLVSDRRIRTLNARYQKNRPLYRCLSLSPGTEAARAAGAHGCGSLAGVLPRKFIPAPQTRPPRLLGDVVISMPPPSGRRRYMGIVSTRKSFDWWCTGSCT